MVKNIVTKKNKKSKRKQFQEILEKYGKENVEIIIEHFPKQEKEILILYFGINCKNHSSREIAEKLKTSEKKVAYSVEMKLQDITNILENPQNKHAYTKKDKFYQLFSNFSQEKINIALNMLKERNKNIVIDYYGLYESPSLNQKELSKKYSLSIDFIKRIIKESLEKINKALHIQSGYNLKFEERYGKYAKEDIEFAILSLSNKHREIFNLFYKSNINEEILINKISENYNIKSSTLKTLLSESNKKITETLNEIHKFENLFYTFGDYRVNKIKGKLTSEDKLLISLFSDSNNSKEFLKKVCEYYNINLSKAIEIANFHENNIKKEIKKHVKRIGQFKELFCEYDNESIKTALFLLEERERNIIYMYYGLNGFEYSSMQEIGEKYNLTRARINDILKVNLQKIKNMLANPQKMNTSKDTKLSLSKFKKYNQKDINNALITFSFRNQDILNMKFGLNGKKTFSEYEIGNKYSIPVEGIKKIIEVSSMSLENILNNNTIPDIEDKIIYLISTYGLDNFMNVVESINEPDKNLFFMYHGICGYQKHSIEELSINNNIDDKDIYLHINCIYETIENKLINEEQNKVTLERQQQLKNKLISKDKKKIKRALKFLPNDEIRLLEHYYNFSKKQFLNEQQICKIHGITSEELNQLLDETINKINNIIIENQDNRKR